jgi:RNA polymerase sigma-70 factor (ECF subfamily)
MAQRIPPEAAAQVARLFIEESPAVFRSALRAARGNRSEVDDLVQEAFQAAVLSWESIGGLSADRKRAWLCRVAINKAIDGYRAGKLVQPTANLDAAGEMPSTEHAALSRIVKERCLRVISDMPEARSRVAYLRFHEEWDTREIAEHLGIAVSTVRVHVHDARVMLEAAMGSEVQLTDDTDEKAGTGEEAR